MAGQIIQRGETTWLVRVYTGQDAATAKRTYHNHTVHGNKKAAQKYLNGVLRERDLGRFETAEKTMVATLLDDLLLDYKVNEQSHDWAAGSCRVHLRPFFGSMLAAGVGTAQVREYIAKRREPTTRTVGKDKIRKYPPAANATINRELALLRRAYNLGKRTTPAKVDSVPMIPVLAENNARKGFFENEAFVKVRSELPEELRPLITFAYYTGCRKGEILKLVWDQVDLSERVVRLEVGETKNKDARTIFMAPELYQALLMQKEMRDCYFPECPWVFARSGKRIRDFKRAWKGACARAGLANKEGEPEKLFHDLRRTGVRNLVRAGVPERVAMMISGHKTRAVFDRYNIVSESDLKDAARRLGEFFAHKTAKPENPHTMRTQDAARPS